jgi:hypothetical protein
MGFSIISRDIYLLKEIVDSDWRQNVRSLLIIQDCQWVRRHPSR